MTIRSVIFDIGGVLFGVGSGGSTAFWVKIVVPSDEPLIVFEPLLLVEVALMFQASGTDIILPDDACYDLDGDAFVDCGEAEADFQYEHSYFLFNHDYEIDPLHGVEFRLFGLEAPTREQCEALMMSPATFDLNEKYYCYETTEGRFGWINIDNFNSSALRFDFGTYPLP